VLALSTVGFMLISPESWGAEKNIAAMVSVKISLFYMRV
jgi:hypothetical protein